jgi:3-hydroxyacyl-[acyl-carrier-protein] dehydratase
LKNLLDLFYIENYVVNEKGFSSEIRLDPEHIVYAGHFPGHPVTPGVIQMFIVHNLLEKHLGKKILLMSVSQCKFLKILNPVENSYLTVKVNIEFNEESFTVSASGANDKDIFFKLNATYRCI